MPLYFEKISSTQLESLSREKTAFFFPVGPLEDHGPHLPMGLDLLEAERIALLSAEKTEKEMTGWTVIIMPKAPLGIDSATSKIAITVRGHVLRDWLVDACLGLSRAGFSHFVCFSGNAGPKQLTAIEEAGKVLRQRGRKFGIPRLWGKKFSHPTLVSASSTCIEKAEASTSPFWPSPPEHGGERDTSVALAIHPELVDKMMAGLPDQEREGTFLERFIRHNKHTISGYWGAPSQGRAARGDMILDEKVNQIFPKLRAVWEGANPEKLFRSWFSIYPSNKSFFKAWLLAIALTVLMSIWVFSNFTGFLKD